MVATHSNLNLEPHLYGSWMFRLGGHIRRRDFGGQAHFNYGVHSSLSHHSSPRCGAVDSVCIGAESSPGSQPHAASVEVHENVLSGEEIEAGQADVRELVKAASETNAVFRFLKGNGKTLDSHGKQKVRSV